MSTPGDATLQSTASSTIASSFVSNIMAQQETSPKNADSFVDKNEFQPCTASDSDHRERLALYLPQSSNDEDFDKLFHKSLVSWKQNGRQTDLKLLRDVYLAINASKEVNHPIALKIRYMISDAIRRRILAGGIMVEFPFFVPRTDIDHFLLDTGLDGVFDTATTMATEDGLYKPEEDNSESAAALIFLRQVAVYGYLKVWLYRYELKRLAIPTCWWHVFMIFKQVNKMQGKLSLFRLLASILAIVQMVYCMHTFSGWDMSRIVSLNLLCLSTNPEPDWHGRWGLYSLMFVFQLFGLPLEWLTQLLFSVLVFMFCISVMVLVYDYVDLALLKGLVTGGRRGIGGG
jgi:hypothetical protein